MENAEKLFSIIVPAYNVEKYIGECLDSILKQKNKNYEIIIINDGSNDKTSDVINQYKEKFENIKIISRENRGLLYTRVEGVENASGKYIVFVDSDDIIPEDTLEIYESISKEDDYDIIRGNYYIYNENKRIEQNNFTEMYTITKKEITDKLYIPLLNTPIFNSVWGQVIKKDIINYNEINTSISMGEDLEFNQACYKKMEKMRIVTEYLYCYRRNDNSMTKDMTTKRLERNISDLNKVYNTIIKNVKEFSNEKLLKNAYCSYLKIMNYYFYMFIDKSLQKDKIKESLKTVLNDSKIEEARKLLKFRDIPYKKTKLLLWLLVNKQEKLYILALEILNKVGVKYNN